MLYNFEGVTVGTWLKIRDDLNIHFEYDNINVNDEMVELSGQIVCVTSTDTRCPDTVHVGTSNLLESSFGDGNDDPIWSYWVWTPSMFDYIVDGEIQDISLFDMLSGGEDSA